MCVRDYSRRRRRRRGGSGASRPLRRSFLPSSLCVHIPAYASTPEPHASSRIVLRDLPRTYTHGGVYYIVPRPTVTTRLPGALGRSVVPPLALISRLPSYLESSRGEITTFRKVVRGEGRLCRTLEPRSNREFFGPRDDFSRAFRRYRTRVSDAMYMS